MVQANELRIGNWVDLNGRTTEVEQIDDRGINLSVSNGYSGAIDYDYDGYFEGKQFYSNSIIIKPIPLSPDVLKACGFEYEDMGDDSPYERWICKQYTELWVWNFNDEEWMFCLGNGFEQGGYQSLHQLQNLFYSLCGEELKVSL